MASLRRRLGRRALGRLLGLGWWPELGRPLELGRPWEPGRAPDRPLEPGWPPDRPLEPGWPSALGWPPDRPLEPRRPPEFVPRLKLGRAPEPLEPGWPPDRPLEPGWPPECVPALGLGRRPEPLEPGWPPDRPLEPGRPPEFVPRLKLGRRPELGPSRAGRQSEPGRAAPLPSGLAYRGLGMSGEADRSRSSALFRLSADENEASSAVGPASGRGSQQSQRTAVDLNRGVHAGAAGFPHRLARTACNKVDVLRAVGKGGGKEREARGVGAKGLGLVVGCPPGVQETGQMLSQKVDRGAKPGDGGTGPDDRGACLDSARCCWHVYCSHFVRRRDSFTQGNGG